MELKLFETQSREHNSKQRTVTASFYRQLYEVLKVSDLQAIGGLAQKEHVKQCSDQPKAKLKIFLDICQFFFNLFHLFCYLSLSRSRSLSLNRSLDLKSQVSGLILTGGYILLLEFFCFTLTPILCDNTPIVFLSQATI